jgi:hypothetical protein
MELNVSIHYLDSDGSLPICNLVIQDMEMVHRMWDSGRHHHCRRRYLHGGHGEKTGGDHYDDHTGPHYS